MTEDELLAEYNYIMINNNKMLSYLENDEIFEESCKLPMSEQFKKMYLYGLAITELSKRCALLMEEIEKL